MDRKAIETLAVNAVRDSIVVSGFLDQFIPDNDKEPSWDGSVYIYNDSSKTKDKLRGRLPVQVKGTINNKHSQKEIKYTVSTVDLNNYLYDGGIVFFVVYISSKGDKKQIYYAELPPKKIRILLNDAKNQKNKRILLKKFPEDPNSKAMVFYNCLENCRKQASFSDTRLLSLEELEKSGTLEGITIPFFTMPGVDPKSALLTTEVYLYAKIKGSTIPHPIEVIPQDLSTSEEKDAIITIGDRLFYTKTTIIRTANKVETLIGKSVSIITQPQTHSVKITYKGTTSLRSLAVDLDFMLSFVENKSFQYNNANIPFELDKADFSSFDIETERKRLDYIKKIVQALDCLGCKKDINIETLTQRDFLHIGYLVKAFVEMESVAGLKEDLPKVISIDVGDLRFIVCLSRDNEKSDTYQIMDFFKSELSVVYDNEKGEKLPISQFALLHADDLLKADNIRYDVLLPSFQKIKRHKELMARTNLFLLELITAYDKDSTRTELLTTASSFADWLMESTEEELPHVICLLNKIQIEKRKGTLSITQVQELYEIVENHQNSEDVLTGAYLLLDQQVAAEVHFRKMDLKLQEEFKTYPIYHFWENDGGENN